MVNKAKLQNVGEDNDDNVVIEDEANSESETVETSPSADEAAQTEADLEAAGVNIDEAQEEKVRAREKRALMSAVKQYGGLYGGGKTAMINLAERVTEAAMKKAIDGSNTKEIYDAYKEAADKKGQLDDAGIIPDTATMEKAPVQTNEDSYKSQLSKLGHFITLGNKFDEDAGDFVRRVRNIHIKLLEGDRSTLKVGSTYSIMSQLASVNHKRNVTQGVMTDDEIHDWLYVPKVENAPVTGPKKILDALIAAESAKKGSNSGAHPREGIDNVHLDAAILELQQALGEVGKELLDAHVAEQAKAEAEAQAKADAKAAKAAEAAANKGKRGRRKAA